MTSANIAVVFGLCILRPFDFGADQKSSVDYALRIREVVEFMINHAGTIEYAR